MKKAISILIVVCKCLFCFAQTSATKQTIIPLDNLKGIPFYKDIETNDLAIDGFEIDNKGNFYFLGGDKSACLAVFTGTKQVYRKTYKEFPANQLYLYQSGLYTFNSRENNDLIILNPSNGSLIKKYSHITTKHINSYKFIDSGLVVELLAYPDVTYEQFNLAGKYIKKAVGSYNINIAIIPDKDKESNCEFLGKWNDNFVFWEMTYENNAQIQKFWLVSNKGKVLSTKSIINKGNIFGRVYSENPNEHRKVRNESLYILGRSRNSNDALITEIPLKSFFEIK